jgi:hypothetical protein
MESRVTSTPPTVSSVVPLELSMLVTVPEMLVVP